MNLILKNYQTPLYQTSRKITPLNLFQWLDSIPLFPKVYWKSKAQDLEIAAVGKIVELEEPPQFDSANQSTARFFGGKGFSKTKGLWNGFPESLFFLPKIEIIQQKNEAIMRVNSFDYPQSKDIPFSFEEKRLLFSIGSRKDLPDFQEWEKLVSDFLENKRGLEKVVLARQTTFQLSQPLAPFEFLSKLEQKNATLFGVQLQPGKAFIGATPEKLYQRKGNKIYSEAIAGTKPLTEELVNSEKDRREFQFVKDYIISALRPLCSNLIEGQNQLLKTSHVQHFHCQFEGDLKETTTDAMLLNSLHPTPAVNGTPKEAAFHYINSVEPFDRGWYASALGFISHNEADIAVGIRSALIEGCNIHLYSGGGLVPGSNAQDEWEEREHKIAHFKKALV